MSDGVLLRGPTDSGKFLITGFGVGLDLSGRYTSTEIMKICAKALRTVPEEKRETPYWIPEYNNYAWIIWDRMTERYANSIRQRSHLASTHGIRLEDCENYLGIGSYQECWGSYIGTSSRIAALATAFNGTRGIRLLELGCGTGNQLLALSAYDVDVYGMELNPRMYAERHPLLQERILYGDALIDPWLCWKPRLFDCVIVSMLGFVQYADLTEMFLGIELLLADRGAIILDTFQTLASGTMRPASTYRTAFQAAGFRQVAHLRDPDQLIVMRQ